MLKIHSFLRGIYSFVKAISKKSYRTCAIITAGVAIVSIISLNSNEFGGSGKNKVSAASSLTYHDTKDAEDEESDAEAKIQAGVTWLLTSTQNFDEHSQLNNIFTKINEFEEVVLPKQKGQTLNVKAGIAQELTYADQIQEEVLQKEVVQEEIQEVVETEEEIIQELEPVISLSDKDHNTLLRIVEAEATGEDVIGKLLVANVILNRVNHEEFPDTVYKVVFQKTNGCVQFSPTVDGRYESVTITDETVEAVKRALSGEDQSQGALYFSARSKADPSNMNWFDRNLEWLFEYGGHEFYKIK